MLDSSLRRIDSRRLRFVPAPPRAAPPATLRIFVIVAGLFLGALFLLLQPGVGSSLFKTVWVSTFGTPLGINQLVQLSTPLVLAGCSVAIAARAGLWNIGVEGQLFFGAWLGTAVALYIPVGWSPIYITLILIGSFIGGALWALIPALARAYWDVSEIVTTLMLNFVAVFWIYYWTTGPWGAHELQGSGSITSRAYPPAASLPQFHIGSITFGLGAILALVTAGVLAAGFRYTHHGFFVDYSGTDEVAGWNAGINVPRYRIGAFLLSGGVGGLTGGIVALDQLHSLSTGLSHNTGYIGIVVAVLAGNALLVCIPMGILMAFLSAAGVGLQLSRVSSSSVLFLTGLVMLLAASAGVLARYRLSFGPAGDASEKSASERDSPK